jgi:N-acetylglucosaminyldiphosphoundecaprenol N-acetyl-beta-D-mannosaminyltransferase
MKNIKRYRVLDTPVDAVDMAGALQFVEEYIYDATNHIGFILAVNPEKVFVLRENKFLKSFFERATLLIPDGIGMVKALKFLYGEKVSRVPGADLMQNICQDAPQKKYKIFIYGASEEVNSGACIELKTRYPGINIVGRANGFVKPDEMPQLIEQINKSQAQILFIAMGSPRQEQWMFDNADKLTTVKLCQGIGGTLDTIVGTVERAPLFWQNLGLEWFYRLLKQPSRAIRQVRLLYFVIEVLKSKLFLLK